MKGGGKREDWADDLMQTCTDRRRRDKISQKDGQFSRMKRDGIYLL